MTGCRAVGLTSSSWRRRTKALQCSGAGAAAYRASGMPAEFADALAAVERGIKEGREDQVSTAVLEPTGRPSRAFAAFVPDHAYERTQ